MVVPPPGAGLSHPSALSARAAGYAPVLPGLQLAFPADYGAHAAHRIEWWYATGHLETPRGPMGFQVTFFRLRNKQATKNDGGKQRQPAC